MNLERLAENVDDYQKAKAIFQWLVDNGELTKTSSEIEAMAVDYAFFFASDKKKFEKIKEILES